MAFLNPATKGGCTGDCGTPTNARKASDGQVAPVTSPGERQYGPAAIANLEFTELSQSERAPPAFVLFFAFTNHGRCSIEDPGRLLNSRLVHARIHVPFTPELAAG